MSSVTTAQVTIGNGQALIQNLGPDALYIGDDGVDSTSGIKLVAGKALSVAFSDTALYAVSSGTSDMRLLPDGTGVFDAPAA